MTTAALAIGAITMVVFGFLGAIAALCLVAWGAGIVGHKTFKSLRRVYHLTVIGYWLDRLEREGTHVFKKASKGASNAG